MFLYRVIVLLDSIPFVYCNDDTLASIMGNTCNLGILFSNTFRCVDYKKNNICSLYSCNSTNNTKTFNIFCDFTLSANMDMPEILQLYYPNSTLTDVPSVVDTGYPCFTLQISSQATEDVILIHFNLISEVNYE